MISSRQVETFRDAATQNCARATLFAEAERGGYVAEDWAAVARAINQRMTELGLSQRELIERSQVSKATVGELQRNAAQRRRSTRTLEALSTALEWNPGHLAAVLTGRRIPAISEPLVRSDDDLPGRLAAIEYRLDQLTSRLNELGKLSDQLQSINANVETLVKLISPRHRDIRQ